MREPWERGCLASSSTRQTKMSTYRSLSQFWRRFSTCRAINRRIAHRCATALRPSSAGVLKVQNLTGGTSQLTFSSGLNCSRRLYARTFHSTTSLSSDDYVIVNTPPFAESVTEGDIRWRKGVGDAVAEDEVVGEIETDKTNIEVTSPANGVIEELFVEDGDKVEKGNQLFKLKVTGAAPFKDRPKEDSEESKPASTPPVEEKPAAPSSPPPTGIPSTPPPVPPLPKEPMQEITPSPPTPVPTAASAAAPPVGTRSEHKVKSTRMRLRIAQRLKDSQNTYAMLTTFNEVDMSNAVEMRKNHKDAFLKKHGVKLGFMSVFVKAASFALQSEPVVNAVFEGNEIVYRDYVDISVAVATPKGLVVPVIRNVEAMNFADIERTMNLLGEKARNGELAIEDMDGGTFTISNGGVFGSLMGTPIINPPQSAILGMHAINDRPVAINGKVEIRPMMYLALTYDHRLIDGREAVTFLRKIKAAVEDPRIIMLDL